ncbi:MAG TPA: hypothetical protein PK624_02250 [Spirochaetota bacterium]|nr:hypothetical protein [Spirochaetota bacterium]HOR43595.1 hypothetical protein [Spirochaetota bacterium]HPK55028.1 hypothetical protein [Spirochaetota bacterium]
MLKKFFFILLILPFFLNADEFERIKIAIVPSANGSEYTAMVESALGSDKRFDFIDPKAIPGILDEIENRQTGITEEDDTDKIKLKNVDFLVYFTNISFKSSYTPAVPAEYDKDGNKISNAIAESWYVEATGIIKIVPVEEGGSAKTYKIFGSGSAKNKYLAEGSTKSEMASNVNSSLKSAFPIQSKITDITSSSLKLLKGTSSGIETGQRYQLFSQKKVTVGGKQYSENKKIGYVEIEDAQTEYSSATILFMDDNADLSNAKAVEKSFYGISLEFGTFLLRPKKDDSMKRNIDPFDLKFGIGLFFGNKFQFGYAVNGGYSDGIFSMSPATLHLRYNAHVFRRSYFVFGLSGAFHMAWDSVHIRTESSDFGGTPDEFGRYELDEKTIITGTAFSFTPYIGWKFLLSESTYFQLTAGYGFATDYKWKFSKKTDSDAKNTQSEEEKASITSYNDYMKENRPAGFEVSLSFGIQF